MAGTRRQYAELVSRSGPWIEGLRNMRILVTGATGFIGGHVVALLHEAGADVHAIARRPEPRTSLDTPVTWHRGDLTDGAATAATVAAVEPDRILHLASLVKGARDPELLLPMFEANTASAVHLLDAARAAGVGRVILAGSLEEPTGSDQLATSPYALSKATATAYGRYVRARTDVEVVNLQIFMVYGPAQLDEKKLIPYVIRSLQNGVAPSLSSGVRNVDWVFVTDVAEGIARSCVEPEPDAAVPLGTGTLTTVRSVVEQLVELSGVDVEPTFGSIVDRSEEVERRCDTELTTKQLGWAPSTSLSDGLQATLDWYGTT